MDKKYIAEYVSNIKNKCIITLNKNISLDDLKFKHILVNEKILSYALSHSEDIIIIDIPSFNIQGCEIVFV